MKIEALPPVTVWSQEACRGHSNACSSPCCRLPEPAVTVDHGWMEPTSIAEEYRHADRGLKRRTHMWKEEDGGLNWAHYHDFVPVRIVLVLETRRKEKAGEQAAAVVQSGFGLASEARCIRRMSGLDPVSESSSSGVAVFELLDDDGSNSTAARLPWSGNHCLVEERVR